MGILAVDELMLREPALLVPRLQPFGPIAVDTIHSIGRKCTFCNLGTSAGQVDAVRRKAGAISGTLVRQITNGSQTVRAAVVSGTYISFPWTPITAKDYSLFIVAAYDGSNNTGAGYLVQVLGTGNTITVGSGLNGGGGYSAYEFSLIELVSGSRVYAQATDAFALGDTRMSAWCLTRTASELSVYRDGADVTSVTQAGTGVTLSALNEIRVHGVGSTNLNRNFNIAMTAIFQPALTIDERRSLAADPYQFLVPN